MKDEIEAINSKRADAEVLIVKITKTEANLSTAIFAKRQNTWATKLQILKEQCEINRMEFYKQLVHQVWFILPSV